MKLFRTIVFWCHLATGVCVALVVLIMAATGVLLTYERQIIDWADTHDLDGAPPAPDVQRLGIEDLLLHLEATQAGTPTAITWRPAGDAPIAVAYGREQTLFVNAYTGVVLGEQSEGVRTFFRVVTDWHRWLGAEGENRRTGRAVTGVCNLGFLFLIVSGFYLWWPRNWTRKAIRHVTFFRRGLSPKARNFNWHNVIGFWSLVPLFVIVLSGVMISYPWASDLVYMLASEVAPARQQRPGPDESRTDLLERPHAATRAEQHAPDSVGLDLLFTRATERLPDWRSIALQLSASTDTSVSFAIDRGTGGQPQKRAQLILHRTTGDVVRWEPFAAQAPGRRLRSIFRFAHTGEVLGLVGQTIAGIVSLGTTLLVWTGLALAWRRYRSWRRRRAKQAGRRSAA